MDTTGEDGPPRSRRDRRGRGLRGPLLPASLPGHRSRAERFRGLVEESAHRLATRWPELARVEVSVVDVPPAAEASARHGEPPAVPARRVLGDAIAGGARQAPRIVVYRRPVEAAARADLAAAVHEVVVAQVAELLGRTPEEIDPGSLGG